MHAPYNRHPAHALENCLLLPFTARERTMFHTNIRHGSRCVSHIIAGILQNYVTITSVPCIFKEKNINYFVAKNKLIHSVRVSEFYVQRMRLRIKLFYQLTRNSTLIIICFPTKALTLVSINMYVFCYLVILM